MSTAKSAGARFRAALAAETPLQVVGAVNAYSALLAERAGFRALYLSGAGVANASFGLPDLGITSLNDVCEDVRRITSATELPLLVDADTGWGAAFNISRTVSDLIRSGAAACHLEDQVQAKRCGHRPGKALVSPAEMADRIKAAVDAGVGMVMISTASYPTLGAEKPAAFSPAIVKNLLRGQLGFDGVTITDDLESPAVTSTLPPVVAAASALEAGEDLLLYATSEGASQKVFDQLVREVKGGQLDRAVVQAAYDRITSLKSGPTG
jgi:hypothetical protein